MNKTSTLITTRNGHFRVALDGLPEAPVLILSNSLGTTLEMWDAQIESLAPHFRILRYDTRGHGESCAPDEQYSFDRLADDVLAIMDELDIPTADFCGISMGGHTGLALAIDSGERFRSIAVCNSASRIGTVQGWLDRASTVRRDGKVAMDALAATAATRWFSPAFIVEHPGVVTVLTSTLSGISAQGYAGCCEALAYSDLTPRLPEIGLPALFIAGALDPVTTVEQSAEMARLVPGSTLSVIEASHLSNIEAAAAFNQCLMRFLSR